MSSGKLMPIRSWNAVTPDMGVNCSAMKSRKWTVVKRARRRVRVSG